MPEYNRWLASSQVTSHTYTEVMVYAYLGMALQMEKIIAYLDVSMSVLLDLGHSYWPIKLYGKGLLVA
jgi:hypothetical protein